MIPLTDLTPQAIRDLPDDELRVRIMILQGWELDTSGRRPVLRKGTEIRAALMSDEDWYLPPRFPASYDAAREAVLAWVSKNHYKMQSILHLLPEVGLSSAKSSHVFYEDAYDFIYASPRDLCVALLCAAREVGA